MICGEISVRISEQFRNQSLTRAILLAKHTLLLLVVYKNVLINSSTIRLTLMFSSSQQNLVMDHYLLLVFQVLFL